MTTNPTGKPVKKPSVKKVPAKKTPNATPQTISPLIPGYGLTRKPGYETMSGKKGLSIKKAQDGAKTKDSTAYFSKKADDLSRSMKNKNSKGDFKGGSKDLKSALEALKDEYRQGNKGKSGYDKNGYRLKMKNGGAMLKQAPKSTMEKISSTKLKDVPAKAEKFGKKVIEKGKKLASDTVEKVKNTTVGDAAKTVGNVVKTAASLTPAGMIYKAGKKAANSETAKQIKQEYKDGAIGKSFRNIGNVIKSGLGMDRNGGKVKKKMKNGGSLTGLKASNKRVGPVDPKGAYTKVQKKALAGAKGKASLTKDKQLGATKMAKRGMSMKKK
jgi:hypothetical protein